MKKATFSELRNNAKQYFDAVEKGTAVEVYRHGKPIARIMPIAPETNLAKFKNWQPILLNKKISLSAGIIEERRKRG